MPYSVPDDFFTKLEENVMDEAKSLKNENKAAANFSLFTIHFSLKKALFAVAATVALFFVVQPLFTKNETGDFESVELAFNNLSVDDQDYLLAIYENDEFINYLTNTENEE